MTILVFQILAGIASFWLADKYIPGVQFVGELKYLIMAGAFLGFINYFIKPVVKILTFPLRIITLGIFSWIINMAAVWAVDIFFQELVIDGIIPLFLTTLLVWVVSFFLGLYHPRKKAVIEE
ncbi:MAG: phage holin family protein [Candidatus Nealsonbacteria bacterium]